MLSNCSTYREHHKRKNSFLISSRFHCFSSNNLKVDVDEQVRKCSDSDREDKLKISFFSRLCSSTSISLIFNVNYSMATSQHTKLPTESIGAFLFP